MINLMSEKIATIYRATGRELPKKWAENAGISSDEVVQVTITKDREAKASRLREIMDDIGNQAKKNGLTEEVLNQILNEIDEERSY
jgi:hypothetical protein